MQTHFDRKCEKYNIFGIFPQFTRCELFSHNVSSAPSSSSSAAAAAAPLIWDLLVFFFFLVDGNVCQHIVTFARSAAHDDFLSNSLSKRFHSNLVLPPFSNALRVHCLVHIPWPMLPIEPNKHENGLHKSSMAYSNQSSPTVNVEERLAEATQMNGILQNRIQTENRFRWMFATGTYTHDTAVCLCRGSHSILWSRMSDGIHSRRWNEAQKMKSNKKPMRK